MIGTVVLFEYYSLAKLSVPTQICIDSECIFAQIDGQIASIERFLVPANVVQIITVGKNMWELPPSQTFSCVLLKHEKPEDFEDDIDDLDPLLQPAFPCLTLFPVSSLLAAQLLELPLLYLLLIMVFIHQQSRQEPTGLVRVGFCRNQRPRFANIYSSPADRQAEMIRIMTSCNGAISSVMIFE